MKLLRLPILLLALSALVSCCVPHSVRMEIDNEKRGERFSRAEQYTYRVLTPSGTGSGWAIDEDTLVTAGHVILSTEAAELCVVLGDESWLVSSFEFIPGEDAALLEVVGPALNALPVRMTPPIGGEWVTLAGYPGTTSIVVTEGAVAGSFGFGDNAVDGCVIPGMSGGPVIDMDGRVIGIITATTLPPGRSLGLFIPTSRVLKGIHDALGITYGRTTTGIVGRGG